MAYIPSECSLEEYEAQIYSGYSQHRLYIQHGETIIENASPYASRLVLTNRILDNGSKTFKLDCFVSKEIELDMHDYLITNLEEEIKIKIGTYIESISDYVYVPLGIFKIQDVPTNDKNKTTYKLRDRSINFDFKYNAKPLIDSSEKVDDEGNKYVTKLDILLDICNQANVEYVGNRTFLGYNDRIAIYNNSITARVYVSYIAEQSGNIATINREGNLDFILISQGNLVEREISKDIVESFIEGTNYNILKVVFDNGVVRWENSKGEEVEGDMTSLYINPSNPYIANQEHIDSLGNSIVGFSIDSFKTGKILGNPTIDAYDLIKITYNDRTYITLAQHTLNFVGTMTQTYDTTIEYEERKNNVTLNNDEEFKKGIQTQIDNINGTLTIIAQGQQDMSYQFGTDALQIKKEDDPVNTSIDNEGIKVKNYNTLKSVLNDKGSGFETLIATGTAQLAYLKFVKSVDEDGEKVTDIHHLISNIQTVEDLVGDN